MADQHYFSQEPESAFKPREISVQLDGQKVNVLTSGGIFSPDHIDTGTAILLEEIDEAPRGGNLLDVGCGWGPIALSLALRAPKAHVWAIDVNERSLELTRMNAERLGLKNITVCRPEDVPANLLFEGIWSNPPIRIGKSQLHELLLLWLGKLSPSSEAFLVVQKNLGADSLQRWLDSELPANYSTIRLGTAKAFRVLRVKRKS